MNKNIYEFPGGVEMTEETNLEYKQKLCKCGFTLTTNPEKYEVCHDWFLPIWRCKICREISIKYQEDER